MKIQELIEIKEILKCQDKKLDNILFAVYGDKKANIKGIADKVTSHERYINKDRKLKWVMTGATAGGFGAVVAWIKTHLGI